MQLFRHTNIECNLKIDNDSAFYFLMNLLNQNQNLDEQIITQARANWCPPFSINMQEDVIEFILYILQSIKTKKKR